MVLFKTETMVANKVTPESEPMKTDSINVSAGKRGLIRKESILKHSRSSSEANVNELQKKTGGSPSKKQRSLAALIASKEKEGIKGKKATNELKNNLDKKIPKMCHSTHTNQRKSQTIINVSKVDCPQQEITKREHL